MPEMDIVLFPKIQLHIESEFFPHSSFLTYFYIIYVITSFSFMIHSICGDLSCAPWHVFHKSLYLNNGQGFTNLRRKDPYFFAYVNLVLVITSRTSDAQIVNGHSGNLGNWLVFQTLLWLVRNLFTLSF